MKRIFGFMALIAIACFSLNASCPYTTEPCGVVVQTVCRDYFTSESEWKMFCAELDIAYCGKTDKKFPHAEKVPNIPQLAIP